jgi:hypothetical protein
MNESQTTAEPRRRGRWISTAALALVLILGLTFVAGAAPLAPPPPSPSFAGPGAFCVADTGVNSLQCTANDTRISKLTPAITDVCLPGVDTAKVTFSADLVIGATTRYDLAMYIATDGGSALNGSSCYKDVLQPVAELNVAGNPLNVLGVGPFKNEDGDSCGEANQTVGAFYKLQQELTVTCVDTNKDGVVDPISTCLSWANNADQYVCTGVTATMPGPGTGSKCYCQDLPTGMLVYDGYDFGDLPDNVVGSPDYATFKVSDGPYHSVQEDLNHDGYPDTLGGVPAVWLGPHIDLEADGQPTAGADGDDVNPPGAADDEDGVTPFNAGFWTFDSADFKVNVNGSATDACANNCKVVIWIDWDKDGTFDQKILQDVTVLGDNLVNFNPNFDTVVGMATPPATFYYRVRLYDNPWLNKQNPVYEPTGLVLNGEVEDYYQSTPLAVTLESFTGQASGTGVSLAWVTVSDINTRGFNLYRAESESEAQAGGTQLNTALIPVAALHSTEGHSYTWPDTTAAPGHTYWYRLQDVSMGGAVTDHPPVMVVAGAPTSVGLVSLGATPALSTAMPLTAIGFALLTGFALARRQRR